MTTEFTFVAEAAAFRAALSTVLKCRPAEDRRLPILNAVCIQAETVDAFSVSHRGIDQHIYASVPSEAKTGGVALPSRPLAAFLAAADGERIEIMSREGRAVLNCGSYAASIVPLSIDDAPSAPILADEAPSLSLAEGALASLLEMSAFTSKEETRYYLNGVCLECDGKTLRATATNGHMLGTRVLTLPSEAPTFATIIPNAAVTALRLLAKGREVDMRVGDKGISFAFADRIALVTKPIDGAFPDWRRVVPDRVSYSFEIDAPRILRFAKLAQGLAHKRASSALRVDATKQGMVLRAEDGGNWGGCSATMLVEGEAPEFGHVGMSPYLLSKLMKALGTPRLRVDLMDSGGTTPIKFSDPSGADSGFAVLMPMRV